ncbi:MAG: hypothetical protein K0U20_08605 [Proteobacteria bacterium]|nr:hypothetical protein [Pseudomonadota bacterium]
MNAIINKTDTRYINGELYCCVESYGNRRVMENVTDENDKISATEFEIIKMPKQQVRELIYSQNGMKCEKVGKSYNMTGGKFNEHRLDVSVTDQDRLLAHWKGYLEANGVEYTGFKFDKMVDLKAAISKEYQRAVKAVRDCGYKFTRGEPSLIMMKDGDRHYDPIYYTGPLTKKFIDSVIAEYPDMDELCYDNGIDGAETFLDMHEYSNYDPSVDYATVTIYQK